MHVKFKFYEGYILLENIRVKYNGIQERLKRLSPLTFSTHKGLKLFDAMETNIITTSDGEIVKVFLNIFFVLFFFLI